MSTPKNVYTQPVKVTFRVVETGIMREVKSAIIERFETELARREVARALNEHFYGQ